MQLLIHRSVVRLENLFRRSSQVSLMLVWGLTLLSSKVLRVQCYFPTENIWSFIHLDTDYQMPPGTVVSAEDTYNRVSGLKEFLVQSRP